MSVAIQALDKGDVDPNYLAKLAKIATSEVISTKVNETPLYYFLHNDLCDGVWLGMRFKTFETVV